MTRTRDRPEPVLVNSEAKLLTTLLPSCRHSATPSSQPEICWLLAAVLILAAPAGSSVVGRPLSAPVADLNQQISGLSLASNLNPRKVMSDEVVASTPGGIPIAEFIVSIAV
jgi:hypothetical protein